MKTISKSKLRAKMFEIFRHLEKSGEELIVTDRGRPVLKIEPIRKKAPAEVVFAGLQGRVVYMQDINTPTIKEWDS